VARKQDAELASALRSQAENTKRSQTIERSQAFSQNAVVRISEINPFAELMTLHHRRSRTTAGLDLSQRAASQAQPQQRAYKIAETNPLRAAIIYTNLTKRSQIVPELIEVSIFDLAKKVRLSRFTPSNRFAEVPRLGSLARDDKSEEVRAPLSVYDKIKVHYSI
jgi:hypothetical protein